MALGEGVDVEERQDLVRFKELERGNLAWDGVLVSQAGRRLAGTRVPTFDDPAEDTRYRHGFARRLVRSP